MEKIKSYITALVSILFFAVLTLWAVLSPETEFSEAERRKLSSFPPLNAESILTGNFMDQFDSYATDQFPFRDTFRGIKAMTAKHLFLRLENNDLYEADSYLSKLDYPLDPDSVDRAAERFRFVYDKYLAEGDMKTYLAVIPDKNAFLAEEHGYPALDYDALYRRIYEKADFLTPIELRGTVTLSDFYRTDSHLQQDRLLPLAKTLLEGMGRESGGEYEKVTLDTPFYGVYHGQAALPLAPDSISYLTNPTLSACTAYDHQNDKEIPLYDLTLAEGKDPYELFLSGPLSLVTLVNPNAKSDKELILFRDSFGSAVAPLLAEGYAKITLIDIRYLHPALLDRYVEFDSQDVLFLYSSAVLNNSETLL